VDYFTPCAQTIIETGAEDVGTGAPVLLQSSSGILSLMGSKSGSLYVVNADAMGGWCPNSPANMQKIEVGSKPILSTPLFWPLNNCIYVAPAGGNLLPISMPSGLFPSCSSVSHSPELLGPNGATPVLSANNGTGAILWLIDTSGTAAMPNTPAILRAYDANNLSNELYNSAALPGDAAGAAVKFTVPTVANGKVYVATQGELDVYGLK
jgi:hypothetical protein